MKFTHRKIKNNRSIKAICAIIVFSFVLSSCPQCPNPRIVDDQGTNIHSNLDKLPSYPTYFSTYTDSYDYKYKLALECDRRKHQTDMLILEKNIAFYEKLRKQEQIDAKARRVEVEKNNSIYNKNIPRIQSKCDYSQKELNKKLPLNRPFVIKRWHESQKRLQRLQKILPIKHPFVIKTSCPNAQLALYKKYFGFRAFNKQKQDDEKK
ncbi:hypothetical protein AGMMS49936_06630 [Endomicrobiia bacterium]|nr:hypothetical protein AGMMS49936_06630 [Endomicrobiia bacterium]